MVVRILIGDVFEKLRGLPSDSMHCVVTSPPYWGLRDYGVAGQIGLERTLGAHLETMVAVFGEIRRVLRPDGTCWINYGDSYATRPNGRGAAAAKAAGGDDRTFRDKPFSTVGPVCDRDGRGTITAGGTLKAKDLCMIPNRLAIALQDDGWWVRSEIIWAKPNPMPESVTDRPANSHEKIFLLTKSSRYFYDAEAVRETAKTDWRTRTDGFRSKNVYTSVYNAKLTNVPGNHAKPEARNKKDKQRGHGRRHAGFEERWDQMTKAEQQINGRNLRNVWTVATKPFRDAHFATMPPALVETCVKAGCPAGGVVLDPFAGAGTTGLVADRLGWDCVLIELNPAYAEIARRRIAADQGALLDSVEMVA